MGLTRRNWMKSVAGMSTGLWLGSALTDRLLAAPVSRAEAEAAEAEMFSSARLVRLGSNENPYAPSAAVRKALAQGMDEFNRYSYEQVGEFKKLVAQREGVSPDHILVTNGSSESLCLAGLGVSLEGGSVLSAYPIFRLLMDYAAKFHARWDAVDLDETLTHDLDALAAALKTDTRLLFICNPNNPTGTVVPGDRFRAFAREMSKKTTVFADEAYLEFLEPEEQKSLVSLVKEGRQVLVSRTFSKVYGLAGLRMAYLIGPPDLLQKLARYQMGPVINQAALVAARAALEDTDFVSFTRKKNAEALTYFQNYLDRKGWFYGKSRANCVLFPAPREGKYILAQTQAKGFQIRVWEYQQKEWCRVSIGTLAEMKAFTKAFDEVVA